MLEKFKKFGKINPLEHSKNVVIIKVEADENDGDYVHSEMNISHDAFIELLKEYNDLKSKYGLDKDGKITKKVMEILSVFELEEIVDIWDDRANQLRYSEKTLFYIIFDSFIPYANHDGGEVHSVYFDIVIYDEEGKEFSFDMKL